MVAMRPRGLIHYIDLNYVFRSISFCLLRGRGRYKMNGILNQLSMNMWDTVEAFLKARGFRSYEQRDVAPAARKVLFQKRLEDVEPVCQCNDKLHLNVTLYAFSMNGNLHESAEMDITGEMPDGEWAKLSFYSMNLPALLEKLDQLEPRLVAAWRASCEGAVKPASIDT